MQVQIQKSAQNPAAREGGVARAQEQPAPPVIWGDGEGNCTAAKDVLCIGDSTAPVAHYRYVDGIAEPDPSVTPGMIRTTNASEICAKSFRTGPYRRTTPAMKKHVCQAYGVSPCPQAGKMELDHDLPLELGGLDSESNIWVQFAPEFHWKDILENELRHAVCIDKTIGLPEAQKCIMSDWVSCYKQQIGPLPNN